MLVLHLLELMSPLDYIEYLIILINNYIEVLVEFTTTTGGKTDTYLKWKLENVVFTGYSVHGNATGEPLPSEQVSCNFTKITYTYTEFDNKTGSKKGNVEAAYEMGANKA